MMPRLMTLGFRESLGFYATLPSARESIWSLPCSAMGPFDAPLDCEDMSRQLGQPIRCYGATPLSCADVELLCVDVASA